MSTTPTNFPRVTQSLLTQLAGIRARHDRFQRLLADRPTGIRVTTRSKNPEFDLKPGYLIQIEHIPETIQRRLPPPLPVQVFPLLLTTRTSLRTSPSK